MQVTQLPDGIMNTEVPKPTDEEMQHEYDYFLAERLTGKDKYMAKKNVSSLAGTSQYVVR